jgi:hypothetical protein
MPWVSISQRRKLTSSSKGLHQPRVISPSWGCPPWVFAEKISCTKPGMEEAETGVPGQPGQHRERPYLTKQNNTTKKFAHIGCPRGPVRESVSYSSSEGCYSLLSEGSEASGLRPDPYLSLCGCRFSNDSVCVCVCVCVPEGGGGSHRQEVSGLN